MINLPQTKEGERIGILGGSFDPPHLGHQMLALCALALEDIEQLWVIPCADHPFAKKLSSFEHRFRMCELAFSFDSRIHIVSIENELEGPNYTVKTLEVIAKQRPALELSFFMGSDVYAQLPKWREPDRLAALSRLVVFKREGSEDISKTSYKAQVHDEFVLPHAKSTLIRENLRNNESQREFVDRRVLEYALRNHLY